MKLKGLIDYDLCNFKIPSMFLIFPTCSFKCDRECGQPVCQNSALAHEPTIEIDIINIIYRYIHNPLTHAVVCGGLEPFDTWHDLYVFCSVFRNFSKDPIVIYTGYKEEEISEYIEILSKLNNIPLDSPFKSIPVFFPKPKLLIYLNNLSLPSLFPNDTKPGLQLFCTTCKYV